jgi:hypothetical protein
MGINTNDVKSFEDMAEEMEAQGTVAENTDPVTTDEGITEATTEKAVADDTKTETPA